MRVTLIVLGGWLFASLALGLVYCFAAERAYRRGYAEGYREAAHGRAASPRLAGDRGTDAAALGAWR